MGDAGAGAGWRRRWRRRGDPGGYQASRCSAVRGGIWEYEADGRAAGGPVFSGAHQSSSVSDVHAGHVAAGPPQDTRDAGTDAVCHHGKIPVRPGKADHEPGMKIVISLIVSRLT